jgi:hypothetical protein
MNKEIRKSLNRFEAGIKELKALIFPVDYYMDVKALSRYSGISVRRLKDLIRHPEYPLPAYKIGGSIKIKKSEFEIWVNKFRLIPEQDTKVDEIISDVMKDIKKSA